MTLKLGIIGHGFVGKAVDHGFTKDIEKFIVDPAFNNVTIKDTIKAGVQTFFICVPTPSNKEGSIDTSIVESVLQEIAVSGSSPLVILKSTITPDELILIEQKYDSLRIVYNPEFLTEENHLHDFINPSQQIFGGKKEYTLLVEALYARHSECRECPVVHTDLQSSSLVKYTMNTFLAMKVIYFNQMYDLFQHTEPEASWEAFIQMIAIDPRMGESHMMVPGNDGRRGFGGSCFPKDTEALIECAKKQGQSFSVLEKTIEVNQQLRGDG